MLSPLVCGSLRGRNMGVTVPKVVVTSPDQTSVYAKMPYLRLVSPDSYTSVTNLVQLARDGKPPKPDPNTIPIWHHRGGYSTYYGSFSKLADSKTLLITINPSGTTAEIPLQDLSQGAQEYARTMEQKRDNKKAP